MMTALIGNGCGKMLGLIEYVMCVQAKTRQVQQLHVHINLVKPYGQPYIGLAVVRFALSVVRRAYSNDNNDFSSPQTSQSSEVTLPFEVRFGDIQDGKLLLLFSYHIEFGISPSYS